MSEFILSHLGSIGLILDMFGVSILFFVVVTLGEQIGLADRDEDQIRISKKTRKESILKTGYGLIFLGFVLQLLSNEIHNTTLDINKRPLENQDINRQQKTLITWADIKGPWYLNRWTSYHTLVFSDKTVFVDNHIDSVFTLNYSLSNDTLTTWSDRLGKKYKNKVINLTKDTLVLNGFIESEDTIGYSRTKREWKN